MVENWPKSEKESEPKPYMFWAKLVIAFLNLNSYIFAHKKYRFLDIENWPKSEKEFFLCTFEFQCWCFCIFFVCGHWKLAKFLKRVRTETLYLLNFRILVLFRFTYDGWQDIAIFLHCICKLQIFCIVFYIVAITLTKGIGQS